MKSTVSGSPPTQIADERGVSWPSGHASFTAGLFSDREAEHLSLIVAAGGSRRVDRSLSSM
jgi:hypothetical protein